MTDVTARYLQQHQIYQLNRDGCISSPSLQLHKHLSLYSTCCLPEWAWPEPCLESLGPLVLLCSGACTPPELQNVTAHLLLLSQLPARHMYKALKLNSGNMHGVERGQIPDILFFPSFLSLNLLSGAPHQLITVHPEYLQLFLDK